MQIFQIILEGAAAGGGRTHFELLQLSVFLQVLNLKTM